MRVGILTFHMGPNYGGFLQAVSLQHGLKALGAEVEFVNVTNAALRRSHAFKPWVFRRPETFAAYWRKRNVFRRSIAELQQTRHFPQSSEISELNYDVIVVGSDVVWNFEDPCYGRDPIYAGVLPKSNRATLISYAPSIGNMDSEFHIPAQYIEGLRSFKAHAVRDDRTKDWLYRNTGRRAEIVVDPTWLPDCPGLAEPVRDIGKGDMIIYGQFAGLEALSIKAAADKRGLRTVSTGFYNRWCEVNRLDLRPLAWVTAVRQADAVVTGAFHGTMFAIRERKPFALVGSAANLRKAVYWLDELDLRAHLCERSEDIDATLDSYINWGEISARIAAAAIDSHRYLKESLS